MTPYVHAIRALTVMLFRKLAISTAWLVGGLIVVIHVAIAAAAIALSPWWLLLLIFTLPITLIVSALGLFGWTMSSRLMPRRLSGAESAQLYGFSDKILRLIEARATPLPVVGALIAWDVIARRKHGYVESLVNDTGSLRSDFIDIVKLFR